MVLHFDLLAELRGREGPGGQTACIAIVRLPGSCQDRCAEQKHPVEFRSTLWLAFYG